MAPGWLVWQLSTAFYLETTTPTELATLRSSISVHTVTTPRLRLNNFFGGIYLQLQLVVFISILPAVVVAPSTSCGTGASLNVVVSSAAVPNETTYERST